MISFSSCEIRDTSASTYSTAYTSQMCVTALDHGVRTYPKSKGKQQAAVNSPQLADSF